MNIRMMNTFKLLVVVLLGTFFLVGCGILPGASGVTPSNTAQPAIIGPEAAREVALAYIRTYHQNAGPTGEVFWFDEAVPPSGLEGSFTSKYRFEAWVVMVTYASAAPEATIYTVSLENSTDNFSWQGLVDATGQVVETSYQAAVPATQEPQPTAPQAASATPIPTITATAQPSPTSTITPTPTATAIPVSCNMAKFVTDVSIQDGTIFYPGADFTKTWRLKNVGTCTWTTDYDIAFVSGDRMGSNVVQSMPGQVKPGETIDISLALKAPKTSGNYQGFWMLREPSGVLFGLGSQANESFWVKINVVDFDEGSFGFDFALNYCLANWRSDTQRLPCPGFSNSADGFSILLSNPDLENRHEDQPTLWVHPNEERYGWVEGTYPAYKVQAGDVFKAWVGCLYGYDRCSLTFYLDYLDKNDKLHRLDEWTEVYDGEVTKIEVDLSSLEGQSVRFILGVEANTKNVEDAQGFWFVPRIE